MEQEQQPQRRLPHSENPRLPRDEDGYTRSFAPDDHEGIAAFFAEHGVVAVRDVLTPERVEATVDEIFACPQINAKTGAAVKDRTDPSDWEDARWPTAGFMHKRGFISPYADYELRESWTNRQDPHVVAVFRALLGRRELLVKLDRYGVMRPMVMPGGEVREEYGSAERWLHWDQNPWDKPGYYGVQGLIALSESHDARGNGGFACVPGLHADGRFGRWADAHEARRGGVVKVPDDDPLYAEAERVNVRPGTLVVWDSRILHQNTPNRSKDFRLVQYVTFFPEGDPALPPGEVADRLVLFASDEKAAAAPKSSRKGGVAFEVDARAPVPEFDFPSYLSPLGLRILGAVPWSHEEEE